MNRSMTKYALSTNLSAKYDNTHVLYVLALMKYTYNELINNIHNEGGYIDKEGIIHKGKAVNKVVEV